MYKRTNEDSDSKYKNDNKQLKILIVDDDENSRDSLKDMIRIRGHNVIILDEGMKCINRCYENSFDLIFMDYHINDLDGEVNGTDISKMIKECLNIDTPIYAYTGDNSTNAMKDFKTKNMKGVLIKPVEPGLICEFMKIIEGDLDDKIKLYKLGLKNKNFIYFNDGKNNKNNKNNKNK